MVTNNIINDVNMLRTLVLLLLSSSSLNFRIDSLHDDCCSERSAQLTDAVYLSILHLEVYSWPSEDQLKMQPSADNRSLPNLSSNFHPITEYNMYKHTWILDSYSYSNNFHYLVVVQTSLQTTDEVVHDVHNIIVLIIVIIIIVITISIR